jgi:hypothetical protein
MLCFGWVLRVPGIACLLAAATMVWFLPLRIDLNVANVNQVQLGMAGVDCRHVDFVGNRADTETQS